MDESQTRSSEPTATYIPPSGLDQKFCMDCGKSILRRAEICPLCGCRQMPIASSAPFSNPFASQRTPAAQSQFTGQMVLLLALNVLWSGLGNLAIGDKRGWQFVFINVIVYVVGAFTAFIPVFLFFAFCGYAGYQFLIAREASETPLT